MDTEKSSADRRADHPEVRAGDPFAAAGAKQARRGHRRTEADLVEALAEEEAKRGYPMTPRQRDRFAREFYAPEYSRDLQRAFMRGMGLAREEDGEEE